MVISTRQKLKNEGAKTFEYVASGDQEVKVMGRKNCSFFFSNVNIVVIIMAAFGAVKGLIYVNLPSCLGFKNLRSKKEWQEKENLSLAHGAGRLGKPNHTQHVCAYSGRESTKLPRLSQLEK